MITRIGVWGLAIAALSTGCAEAGPGESAGGAAAEGEVAEVAGALASCNAPVNAHADWLASTREGEPWCVNCTFVTVTITEAQTGRPVLNYWAGIDEVAQHYVPGFCWGGTCFPGFMVRDGIRGDFYGDVSVGLGGDVRFDGGGARISIAPESCAADASSGATTIVGLGSNGVRYRVVLTNTWFS